jgi:hypothetical protein
MLTLTNVVCTVVKVELDKSKGFARKRPYIPQFGFLDLSKFRAAWARCSNGGVSLYENLAGLEGIAGEDPAGIAVSCNMDRFCLKVRDDDERSLPRSVVDDDGGQEYILSCHGRTTT